MDIIIAIIQQYTVAFGFAGVAIGMVVSFLALEREPRRKYGVWFQISIVMIFLATFLQIICAAIPIRLFQ